MVRFNYDIFGAITAVKNGSNQTITDTANLAFLNPLRYRGYVYDDETGLYYLQSRYYDPVTGRFLNADIYVDTDSGSPLSTNMFAYCENNYLLRKDIIGYWYEDLDEYNDYLVSLKRIIDKGYKNNNTSWQKTALGYQLSYYNSCKTYYQSVKSRYNYNLYKLRRNIKYYRFIYGQEEKYIKDLKLGYGNVGDNGCGAVALYNVMMTKSGRPNLASIIATLEINKALRLGGYLGVRLDGIEKYLLTFHISYRKFKSAEDFEWYSHIYTISIVYSKNKDDISEHYYCIYRVGGRYYTINLYSNDNTARPLWDFSNITKVICILANL